MHWRVFRQGETGKLVFPSTTYGKTWDCHFLGSPRSDPIPLGIICFYVLGRLSIERGSGRRTLERSPKWVVLKGRDLSAFTLNNIPFQTIKSAANLLAERKFAGIFMGMLLFPFKGDIQELRRCPRTNGGGCWFNGFKQRDTEPYDCVRLMNGYSIGWKFEKY
jgi:hypothetical protein